MIKFTGPGTTTGFSPDLVVAEVVMDVCSFLNMANFVAMALEHHPRAADDAYQCQD
jgi:hypothetical protein